MRNFPLENVIIIGGGPAGLAAATYISRAGLKPLVFAGSPPGGQLTLTTEVENYPGFPSIMGPELIEKMRTQALSFDTRIINENVSRVDFSKTPFKLFVSKNVIRKVYPDGLVDERTEYAVESKAVIIATGAEALWLGLESEQKLRGRGVSACATCDGFFFKNKNVAVIGGGDTAMEEALVLTKFANKVYVIHRRDSFRASKIMQERVLKHPKIEVIWNAQVLEVVGEMKVEGAKLKITTDKGEENRDIAIDGFFTAIGHKPSTSLFKDQVNLDEKGYIMTFNRLAEDVLRGKVTLPESRLKKLKEIETHYSTATIAPGVFAAGDCVDHVYRQAATAAGMGVAAALDVERYLMDAPVTPTQW